MMPLSLASPPSILGALAERARARRLQRNLTQAALAAAAGVSLASLRRFERTGAIALEGAVRVALVLGATEPLERWFEAAPVVSIDEAIARTRVRQRDRGTNGRLRRQCRSKVDAHASGRGQDPGQQVPRRTWAFVEQRL